MKGTSFTQWVLLACIIGVFILFKTIHLQVGRYNLFLALLISSAFVAVLCTWMLEKRGKEGQRPGEHESR